MYPPTVPTRAVMGLGRMVALSMGKRLNVNSSAVILKNVRAFSTDLKADNFINGTSSIYVEDMYQQWQKDPNSVHPVSKILACMNYL